MQNAPQSLPGVHFLPPKKHLAFVIPLRRPATKISLFSFVDSSFCIVCPPTTIDHYKIHDSAGRSASSKRHVFHRAPSGVNIFVFKLKSRSRAADWMWHLWYVQWPKTCRLLTNTQTGDNLAVTRQSSSRSPFHMLPLASGLMFPMATS